MRVGTYSSGMKLPLVACSLASVIAFASLTGCSAGREIRVEVKGSPGGKDLCANVEFGAQVQKGSLSTPKKEDTKPLDAKIVLDERISGNCTYRVSVPKIDKSESLAILITSEGFANGTRTYPGSVLDDMTRSETPVVVSLPSR